MTNSKVNTNKALVKEAVKVYTKYLTKVQNQKNAQKRAEEVVAKVAKKGDEALKRAINGTKIWLNKDVIGLDKNIKKLAGKNIKIGKDIEIDKYTTKNEELLINAKALACLAKVAKAQEEERYAHIVESADKIEVYLSEYPILEAWNYIDDSAEDENAELVLSFAI